MLSDVTGVPRQAIIYLPGLGEWIDHSLEGFAQRFSFELRRKTSSPDTHFVIESALRGDEPVPLTAKDVTIEMCSIRRKEGDHILAFIDVYRFDYAAAMAKNYERMNLLVKGLRLLAGILINLPRIAWAVAGRSRPKKLQDLIQVLFGAGIVLLLILYLFILGTALVDTIKGSHQFNQLVAQVIPAAASPPAAHPQSLTFAQTLVILLALMEIFIPELRKMIEKTAVDNLCILDYLSLGERKNIICGELDNLLLALSKVGWYQEINMVAFSFGSITALDWLFPYGRQSTMVPRRINTLVTIGCPFDLVRTFWPQYFQNRRVLADNPQHWINIYSPIDALASNFESNKGAASDILIRKPDNIVYNSGSNPDTLSKLAWLTLVGLRAHTAYWEKESYTAASCMKDVVANLPSAVDMTS